MPIYEFKCSRCLNKFERVYSINDQKYPICPYCNYDKVLRVFNAFPILYKIGGFYSKDNKNK